MANIMIRQSEKGGLSFYLPKRDLEASIEWRIQKVSATVNR